jgi:hypothetical protein
MVQWTDTVTHCGARKLQIRNVLIEQAPGLSLSDEKIVI